MAHALGINLRLFDRRTRTRRKSSRTCTFSHSALALRSIVYFAPLNIDFYTYQNIFHTYMHMQGEPITLRTLNIFDSRKFEKTLRKGMMHESKTGKHFLVEFQVENDLWVKLDIFIHSSTLGHWNLLPFVIRPQDRMDENVCLSMWERFAYIFHSKNLIANVIRGIEN